MVEPKNSTSTQSAKVGDAVPAAWNATAVAYPQEATLPALLAQQFARTPDAIALVFGSASLTYKELDRRSNQLARHLIHHGVGPDTLVGISAFRSIEMVVGLLAIIKAGGAYVPIDPEYPKERLAFMLKDTAPIVLLTQAAVLPTLSASAAKKICLDSEWAVIATEDPSALPVAITASNLAYMIYTSGSTGNPKGAINHHLGVCNRLLWMQDEYKLTPADNVLQKTPFSFDVSVWEFFWPLLVGARLVIARPGGHQDPSYLAQLIRDQKITVLHFVPSMLRTFLDEPTASQCTTLRHVICSGEALTADLQEKFFGLLGCELHNLYGPTEAAVDVTYWRCQRSSNSNVVPIGRPVANTQIHILDETLKPVPIGSEGELHIGGVQVGRGYHNRPELTAEKFIRDPFSPDPSARLYKTGDLARWTPDGVVEYLGRIDFQVKIRGFRIELGEIESVLAQHSAVQQAVVVAVDEPGRDKRLIAYLSSRNASEATVTDLRNHLLKRLPEYMVPALFIWLEKIPLSPNGKVDRKALPKPSNHRPALARAYVAPSSPIEQRLAALWRDILGLDLVGIDDSFFELGGTSLLAVRMASTWSKQQGQELPLVKVFQFPTVAGLAAWMDNKDKGAKDLDAVNRRAARANASSANNGHQTPIAIIGMVGRFPGAEDLETLWKNLCGGVESITVFKREELGIGIDESLRHDPDYVPARGIVTDADCFDAPFFGISPLEASVMDPQQRIFLELAYAALENAGYDPDRTPGPVGVYAGIGDNHYYPVNLLRNPKLLARAGRLAIEYGNEKDYIAMRVAYTLGLTGPAVSANSGCSTSLLAVDNAVRGLASFECDIALAGGVDIHVPQKSGFLFEEGGTFCKDGHCRPFDAEATGTMFCDGAGIVVLRRLDEAIAAGDTIYAVIRGSAKNNNGARAASFLAPSVEGQAEVVAMAQANAGIPIETIRYIEAHGTGTPVGDPIEFEALNQVFNAKTTKRQFCHLGSLKGNIGHPTIASGIAGLIKAALVLHREQIPATLHFKNPNPKIDFPSSCFKMADRLIPFPRGTEPRRAAVSSFGFGGTNVHAILEEAPVALPPAPSRPTHLITLSARTPAAVERYSAALANHFDTLKQEDLANAASTLLLGRKQWSHRRFVVANSPSEAAALLRTPAPQSCGARTCTRRDPPVVFLFGGQGTQYANMGARLYQSEPQFRADVDECCEILRPHLGCDLREVIFPVAGKETAAQESLRNTFYTQPAIFTIEYAIARWWLSLGVQPTMMAGHSIGEFVAATIAGVFELPEVLRVVATRGRLMQSMPSGSMLSVRASAADVEAQLPPNIQLAAINGPTLCVVAGPTDKIAETKTAFEGRGWICRELLTSHAFHSAMMEPILAPLREEFRTVTLRAPARPFVSTVTGEPITPEQACDPEYWVRHARQTVRFSNAARWLIDHGHDLFLECGPRSTMATLTRQHTAPNHSIVAIPSLGDSTEESKELSALLAAAGNLWLNGVTIDWEAFFAHEERQRVPLPTYPFERQRHWVEAIPLATTNQLTAATPSPAAAPADAAAPSTPTLKAPSHKEYVVSRLTEIIAPISGRGDFVLNRSATFLEQGFDSLSLVQVASAIRNELGVRITFSQFIDDYPTIETLADFVQKQIPPATSAPKTEPLATPPNENNPPAPGADLQKLQAELDRLKQQFAKLESMTQPAAPTPNGSQATPNEHTLEMPIPDAQREIWLGSQLGTNASRAYNETLSIRLRGSLDREALETALQSLVDRHDSLRVTFSPNGESLRIHPKRKQTLSFVDLSSVDSAQREHRCHESIDTQNRTPFDLTNGPLLVCQLIRMDGAEHVLQLTGHHIVLDGWSLHLLHQDLSAMYLGAASKKTPELSPSLQFRDYVKWLNEPATVEDRTNSERYWLDVLKDRPPAVELPSLLERPPERSYSAQNVRTRIEKDAFLSLKRTCSQLNCTPFHFILASFHLWLHRSTHQEDVVVGVPTAGQISAGVQHLAGANRLVGHSVNLLPMRSRVVAGESFADFLSRFKRTVLDARKHQNIAFGRLVEKLNFPRQPNRIPLVSVTVNLSDDPEYSWKDLAAESLPSVRSFVFFDLTVNMTETRSGLEIVCVFNSDIVDSPSMERGLSQWCQLMESAAAAPQTACTELSLITKTERERLLVDWNKTDREFPQVSLHRLFEEQATKSHGQIAVLCAERKLTYGQLDARSNRLARYLRRFGVESGSLVGVCMNRSEEMIVALLAILKAGAAYVPLDPIYPAERIAYVISDAQAPVLITENQFAANLQSAAKKLVCIDRDQSEIARESDAALEIATDPNQLAYVIYTSGSTGKPKGVQIPHRAVVNFLNSMRREPGLTANDILLAVTTLSFDIAGLELFLPLVCGARIVVASSQTAMDGRALIAIIDQHQVTVMQATPATWRLMLAAGWQGGPKLKALCGGEAMPADLAAQLLPRCTQLWNMYGPTETTIWSTCSQVLRADDLHIGRPIDNTQIYILDSQQQPLPIGLAGELLIGGDGLAHGYHRRPELTADRFIDHPFKAGEKLYRTGDLARWRPDGAIDCLGRLDFQVKIRGFRIELGEIETQLASHADIKHAVVTAREDIPGDKRLVAYLIAQPGTTPTAAALREHLRGKLPEYMVPSAFVTLDSFPLTPNGKIDRKALPKPDTATTPVARQQSPSSDTEKRLAAIFGEVLGQIPTSVLDSFFDLGGHSLLAVKLMAAIERDFTIRLPLASLFDAPSIAQLAALLSKGTAKTHWSSLMPIRPQEGKPTLFLVHGAGGNVLLYRELADAIGPKISIYGFQSQGLDRRTRPLRSIEEMAEHYVRELRGFQPEGPYHIGGYCMGGAVIFEMARLLQKQGARVGLVALLDSYNLSTVKNNGTDSSGSSRLRQKIRFHISNLLGLKAREVPDYLGEKIRMAIELSRAMLTARFNRRAASNTTTGEGSAEVMIQKINDQAVWEYIPKSSPVPITVFRPRTNYDFMPDLQLGWGNVASGGIDLVTLPVNPHAMLITPCAKILGEEIRKRIAP